MRKHSISVLVLCSLVAIVAVATAQNGRRTTASSRPGPVGDFKPDWTFSGSNLNGWTTVGDATWKAANGDIIGTAANGGGWIIAPKPYKTSVFSRASSAQVRVTLAFCYALRKQLTG